MTILAGFPAGSAPLVINGSSVNAFRLGNTAQITTGAASATVAIPTDANGNKYSVYLLTAVSASVWFNFNTAGDAAVVAASNTIALTAGQSLLVTIPPGTTNLSAIQDTAAGHLLIVGIF